MDMPFGQKSDLKSGVIVDFDQIYNNAIKPAIEQCGLEPLRGDEESTGGITHTAMFARLLLSQFVVASYARQCERVGMNCLDHSSGFLKNLFASSSVGAPLTRAAHPLLAGKSRT